MTPLSLRILESIRGHDDPLVGDLAEEHARGGTRGWLWRQVVAATLRSMVASLKSSDGAAAALAGPALFVLFQEIAAGLGGMVVPVFVRRFGLVPRFGLFDFQTWLAVIPVWLVAIFLCGWAIRRTVPRSFATALLATVVYMAATELPRTLTSLGPWAIGFVLLESLALSAGALWAKETSGNAPLAWK